MSVGTLKLPGPFVSAEQLEPPFELIDGVPKEKPPIGLFANILATYLARAINDFTLPRKLGMAINKTPYKSGEKNSRRPDISYVEIANLPPMDVLIEDPPLLECAPNIAIEMISPSNMTIETEERVVHFFSTGVQLVWIVYPKLRRIHVYESADSCKILGINDVLDGGKVIPGFSLKLADLFNLIGVSSYAN